MTALHKDIRTELKIFDDKKSDLFLSDLISKTQGLNVPLIKSEILSENANPKVQTLVKAVFGASSYLSQIILRHPESLEFALQENLETNLEKRIQILNQQITLDIDINQVMVHLRCFKQDIALLTALNDLAGVRDAMQITEALTKAADCALTLAVRYLLGIEAKKGNYFPDDIGRPEMGSGYIVLAMGKYGAFELNYSSDIDLIIFYEKQKAKLKEGLETAPFFVRVTRDLVKIMQERTADGYVFRTDLRLRPDPGSTQVALSTDAAMVYYESMGQNWERAVYIKARPAAGDKEAGQSFLDELSPFVWRKYLDYAAIAGVHAMKRQIHDHKGHGEITVAGHNVKLGRGGIREIEFFAQTQQLIAGGRQPELRTQKTLETLEKLVEKDWIEKEICESLKASYMFFRHVEHRLQMIADEQTHSLPNTEETLERIAYFSGFESLDTFSDHLLSHLRSVQEHYDSLFDDAPEGKVLEAETDFGKETEDTIKQLKEMGFEDPKKLINMVQEWYLGRYPALRSPDTRQRLREFQAVLFEAFSKTASPDQALISFDRFVANLPSGIQLFSLLKSNPELLRLIADIMGTAPRLSQFLSRHSRVLDVVLDPGFFGTLPSEDALKSMLLEMYEEAKDYQDILDGARSIGQEQSFLIGVKTISGSITAEQSGHAYAVLAETLIRWLQSAVQSELDTINGKIENSHVAVLAMGKLGGLEMAASSDLDIIVIYDFDNEVKASDGEKPLAPQQYFTRLTQRLISSLTVPTSLGSLYEVDMRLRPSGQSGPLATQFNSFKSYQCEKAWTWEHMALTRARVISGSDEFKQKLENTIKDVLSAERNPETIAKDILDMRKRLSKERSTNNIWNIKMIRGGLVDLEFITQYLQLIHAGKYPDILDQNTLGALEKITAHNLLDTGAAETLHSAAELYNKLTQILRLCVTGEFHSEKAPEALKNLLARTTQDPGFSQLEDRLKETLSNVSNIFNSLIGE